MNAIVDHADATDPRLNDAFREYAQTRGFVVDQARVHHPRDKPRVERCAQYVRSNFLPDDAWVRHGDVRRRRVVRQGNLHRPRIDEKGAVTAPVFIARVADGMDG